MRETTKKRSFRRRPSFGLSASGRMASMEQTGEAAECHSNRFEKMSSFFSTAREGMVLRLRPEDVVRGSLVGKGAYNNVYEASLKVGGWEEPADDLAGSLHNYYSRRLSGAGRRSDRIHDEPAKSVTNDSNSIPSSDGRSLTAVDDVAGESVASLPTEGGTHTSSTCLSEDDKQQRRGQRHRRYVLKCIRPSYLNNPERYKNGIIDLVLECKTLASMAQHENVIRLHGVSAGGIAENVSEGKFFLILERVQCTLSDRIAEWRTVHHPSIMTILARSLHIGDSSVRAAIGEPDNLDGEDCLCCQRLRIASGLVAGLRHIHAHNIAFRDLKPGNIGLDELGSVKILDFGFAKEVLTEEHCKNKRRPTGMVGTLRYMAPEVALCRHYDQRCDIYSLAVVLWELWSLKKPYSNKNRRQIQERVICGGERPKVSVSWPGQIQDSIRQCWEEDPELRPTLESISGSILNAQRRRRRRNHSLLKFLDLSTSLHSKKGSHQAAHSAP